jgi:peptidoglycan hydrolase CwlO-like protein
MKQVSAILAALIITGLIGLAILLIGANALFNKSGLTILNSPASALAAAADPVASNPETSSSTAAATQASADQAASAAQIQQLQNLISQYQQREKQYQDQLDQAKQQISQASQQIDQANGQLQQYQGLFQELVRRGIITIGTDGNIYVPRGSKP